MTEPNISAHCTYREATVSATAERLGLDNTPSASVLASMRLVAEKCFEPARAQFGPLRVTSFYRSPPLNKAVGGSKTSTHPLGEAIDMESIKDTNANLFRWCLANLQFDQLIWEFGTDDEPAWVHISYRAVGNRQSALRAKLIHGATMYTPFAEVS